MNLEIQKQVRSQSEIGNEKYSIVLENYADFYGKPAKRKKPRNCSPKLSLRRAGSSTA